MAALVRVEGESQHKDPRCPEAHSVLFPQHSQNPPEAYKDSGAPGKLQSRKGGILTYNFPFC